MEPAQLEELAAAFTQVAREVNSDDPEPVLELGVRYVPGCRWASITTIGPDGRGHTLAATADEARQADEAQHRNGQGPCMEAARERAYHTVFRVEGDDRWPVVGREMAERTPVRSVLAVHMLEGDPTSLNLYGDTLDGFDSDSVTYAAIIAGQAATLLSAKDPEQAMNRLSAALSANRELETAVAVLTSDGLNDREAALLLLYAASRRLHRDLRSVARDVVAEGALPD